MASGSDVSSELAYQQKRCQELEHQLDKILFKLYESEAQNAKLWAALNLLTPSTARDGEVPVPAPLSDFATPDPYRVLGDVTRVLESVVGLAGGASAAAVVAPTPVAPEPSAEPEAAVPVASAPVAPELPAEPEPLMEEAIAADEGPVVIEPATPALPQMQPLPVRARIIEIEPPKAETCLPHLVLEGAIQAIPTPVLGAHAVAFLGLAVEGSDAQRGELHVRAYVRSAAARFIRLAVKFGSHPQALILMADIREKALVTSRDGIAALKGITFAEVEDDWLRIDLDILVSASDVISLEIGASPSGDIKSFRFKGLPSQSLDIGLISYGLGKKREATFPGKRDDGTSETGEPSSGVSAAFTGPIAFGGGATDFALRQPRLTMKGKLLSEQKSDEIRAQRKALIDAFEGSGELARIDELRNRHRGGRAFIVGNGPSIMKQDLTLLADELTFTTNWFVNHAQFNEIKPKFHVVSSHEMFGGWGAKEPKLNERFVEQLAEHKHAPETIFSHRFRDAIRKDARLARNNSRFLIFDRPKFQIDEIDEIGLDLSHPMHDGYTGLITFAIPLVLHMGVEEIYMVGCDCDYGIKKPDDPKSYFYRPDQHPTSTTKFESLDRIWADDGPVFKTYDIVRNAVEASGVAIYNATHGGRLERLPRVSFESLFGKPSAKKAAKLELVA